MTTQKPKQTFYRRVLPDICTAFSSEKGKQLFRDALPTGHMNCYFTLASQFRTQEEPAYCGLSTLVMVLNALAIDPGVVWKGVFRWYHEEMLDCCLSLEEVKKIGVSMDSLMCLAVCNQLEGELKRVSDTACLAEFREEVKIATLREDRAIIVSYSRKVLGQTGSGHFSPIGGYNAMEDMVLIFDVARFKYPPYWLSLAELWKAMKTIDDATGLHRGYMILWRADNVGTEMPSQPPLIFKVSQRLNPSKPILKESAEFLLEIKSFLLKNVGEKTDDEILKKILKTFLEESFNHAQRDDSIPSFLTLRVTEKQLRTQFPEQAEVVEQLIQEINETALCKKITSMLPKGVCCRQALFNTPGSQTGPICMAKNDLGGKDDCIICLQQFLTIFLLSFPIDSVTCCHKCHGKTVMEGDEQASSKTYEGTYFSFLQSLVDAELKAGSCATCSKTKSADKQRRDLLINEVTQLRRQFRVLMNAHAS